MNNRTRTIMRILDGGRLTIDSKVRIFLWYDEDHTNLRAGRFKSSVGFKKQKGKKK